VPPMVDAISVVDGESNSRRNKTLDSILS